MPSGSTGGARHERGDQHHCAGADHDPEAWGATVGRRAGRQGSWTPSRARVDSTLIKALARAHRWQRMLDDGRYGSVSEMAAAEKLDRGYLGRILMLTLLAPDIVEAIMDGRQPAELGVHVLREGFPVQWGEQREALSMRQ